MGLEYVIGADTADAIRGFEEMDRKLNRMRSTVSNVGDTVTKFGVGWSKYVSAPLLAGVGILGATAMSTANLADEIGDLSAATGISTNRIQEWRHWARMANVSQDAMTNASKNLTGQFHRLENGTGRGADAMEALGLEFESLEKLSPEKRLDAVMDALRGLDSESDRVRYGQQLLGGAWDDVAPILAQNKDTLEEWTKAAHESGNVMSKDTLEGFIRFREGVESLKASFSGATKQILTKLEPVLNDVILPLIQDKLGPAFEKFTDLIGRLVDWFVNLSSNTQGVIILLTGLAIVIGPILIGIGVFIKLLAGISIAMIKVVAVVGAVIAIIAALAAAFMYLWRNNEEFREGVIRIWNQISEIISTVISHVVAFVKEKLELLKEFWDENGEQIMQAVSNVFNFIMDVITFVMPYVQKHVAKVWEVIKNIFSSALNIILNGIKFWSAIFTGDWSGAWEAVKAVASSILDYIWNIVKLVLLTGIVGTLRMFGGMLVDRFRSAFNNARETAENIMNRILDFITGMRQRFLDAGKGLIEMLAKGITNAAKKAVDAVSNVAKSVRDRLPFSPAKEGPLKDIDKLDFAGPISDSITKGLPKVQAEMAHMLNVPEPSAKRISSGNSNDKSTQPVVIVVELDGRQIAKGTAPHLVEQIRLKTGMVT